MSQGVDLIELLMDDPNIGQAIGTGSVEFAWRETGDTR